MKVTYDYPISRVSNETTAIIDSREFCVCTQYDSVLPCGVNHDDDCERMTNISICAECTCGATEKAMENINKEELLNDAKINGKFGAKPIEIKLVSKDEQNRIDKEIEEHEKFKMFVEDGYGDAICNK